MLKNRLLLSLTLFAALTILSCKKDNNTNNSCANNTGWLVNGHQFVYESSSLFIPADSLYVSLDEVSTGVFKSTSILDDGTVIPTQISYLQPCDNNIYSAVTPDLNNKQETYRVDGNVGDTWTTTSTSSGGNTITTVSTITEKNVSTTVPAGTFVCLKIRQVSTSSAGGSTTSDTYINNNAGLILLDGSSIHYELVRKNF